MGRLIGLIGCLPIGVILALALLAQGTANIGFGVASAEMGATVLTQTLMQPILMLVCGAGGFLLALPVVAAFYIEAKIRLGKKAADLWENTPRLPLPSREERKPKPALPTAADALALPKSDESMVVRRRRAQATQSAIDAGLAAAKATAIIKEANAEADRAAAEIRLAQEKADREATL